MRSFFHRSGKFQPLQSEDERAEQAVPDGLWVKCPKCDELIYSRELENNLWMCPKCDYHHRITARQRIGVLADAESFQEWDAEIRTANPLGFSEPSGSYDSKIAKTIARSGEPGPTSAARARSAATTSASTSTSPPASVRRRSPARSSSPTAPC